MKKICFIFGTRPEIIKCSSLIFECEKRNIPFVIIHTNQHYSNNLDQIFFDELKIPKAKYNLNIGSASHAIQTAKMLESIEPILLKEKPSIVLIQGDTNSALSGALCAVKLHIPVGHIEAGLRSGDRNMPEEINRIIIDHSSDFLFTPTNESKNNLIKEGISNKKIFIAGNTIVDATIANSKIAKKSKILDKLKIKKGNFFLSTVHRQENTDDKDRLSSIISGLNSVSKKYNMPVVLPLHPRTKKMLEVFSIKLPDTIIQIEPVGYLDFLMLQQSAKLVLTDSGGIQEETHILKIPCVTLRDTTERPETLIDGGNLLLGADFSKILNVVEKILAKKIKWTSLFGDGTSATRIIDIIREKI